MLGAGAAESLADDAWDDGLLGDLQRAWGRALLRGNTQGWRLRRDPEPLVGETSLVLPDFALRRGRQGLALCVISSRATAESLTAGLAQIGRSTAVAVLAPATIAAGLRLGKETPVIAYAERPAEAIPGLVLALERIYPRADLPSAPTPWQTLERRVAAEGFLDEASVAAVLGCPTDEAATLVRRWGSPGLHVLSGLGVCDGETLGEIRQLLDRAA
jgi:hypothetical protein